MAATRPLQSFPVLGALDATAQLIPRDDSVRAVSRRRSSLGWAFARQSAITTVIVRKDCESSVDSRAAMMVAKRLLRTPVPPAASVLRPTGSVAEVKLVPPSPLAENRIAAVVVKSKLHIMACDQPWGYDAIASFNAGNASRSSSAVQSSSRGCGASMPQAATTAAKTSAKRRTTQLTRRRAPSSAALSAASTAPVRLAERAVSSIPR